MTNDADGVDIDAAHANHRPFCVGSKAAIAILLSLNRDGGGGMSARELAEDTGLPQPEVQVALQGLRQRGRVVPEGMKKGTVWHLPHLLPAGGPAQ